MFDVANKLAHRVMLTKLVDLNSNIRPYLTILMGATLAWVGEALVALDGR